MKYAIAALALIGSTNAAAADCPDKLAFKYYTSNACDTEETDAAKVTTATAISKSWSAGIATLKTCTGVGGDTPTGYIKVTCDDTKKMTVATFDTSKTDCS